jgi:hypothetical protein
VTDPRTFAVAPGADRCDHCGYVLPDVHRRNGEDGFAIDRGQVVAWTCPKCLAQIRVELPPEPDAPARDADLRALVLKMRTAQRNYFRTRKPETLALAQRLEREVDAALAVDGPGLLPGCS